MDTVDPGDARPHPLGRQAADMVFGLLDGLGLASLGERLPARLVVASGSAVIVAVPLAVVGAVALAVDEPMLVPSLGPTVFLVVFAPRFQVTRPRNIVGSHLVAIGGAVAARFLFGLYGTGPALSGPLTTMEMGAAVVALSSTALLMSSLGVTHPPCAATALVVGLGLVERPIGLVALASGVLLTTLVGIAVARAAGLRLGGRAD